MARLSRRFRFSHASHWPGPRSLATTSGVSVDVLSYGYLDVSVPRVRLLSLWIQDKIPHHNWKPVVLCSHSRAVRILTNAGTAWARPTMADDLAVCMGTNPTNQSPTKQIFQLFKVGFPIRKSSDQRVFAPPRRLSQRITSFIACACQGIHQLPLRHLIILIANIHQIFPTQNPTQ